MPDCKQRILPVGKVLCTAGAVAEMTGRKGRLVRNGKSVVYQPRSNTGDTDSLNVKETSGCAVPCVPSVCACPSPKSQLGVGCPSGRRLSVHQRRYILL